jgi:SSS family transporter
MLLAAYTAMMVHHAFVGRRSTKGMTDYYVGGRRMGGIAIGISFFATYSSTNSFVGFSGQSYSYGAPWLLLTVCAVGFSLIAWKWVAPRLRVFTARLDSVTLPDFIGFRYGSRSARVMAAGVVLFASFLYMTAIFKGIGNLLEMFLEVPYPVAIAIVFPIVMVYTAAGGFISVVKTDVVQGAVMTLAAVLLFAGTVNAAGGLGALSELRRQPDGAALFGWNVAMPFPVLLGVMVAATMKFMVEPRQLSRFYALKDRTAVRAGMWVSTLLFLGVYSVLVPIGLYARRVIPDGITDTDQVVPLLLSRGTIFSPEIGAFLLVAMVAAAMSSLDSVLLVMASTCARDLIGAWLPPSSDDALVRSTRKYVAAFALITALIALDPPGGIVSMTAFSGSLYAACFFPTVTLGLYWRRGNGNAAIVSFTAGIATLVLWRYLPFGVVVHAVFPAMILSMVCYALISKLGAFHPETPVQALFEPSRGEHPG